MYLKHVYESTDSRILRIRHLVVPSVSIRTSGDCRNQFRSTDRYIFFLERLEKISVTLLKKKK